MPTIVCEGSLSVALYGGRAVTSWPREGCVESMKMLAMGGHLLPQVGLMVGLVLVGVCVCGARASETPPTMTLDEIGKALDREPASLSVDSFDRRARILEQLDQHLSVADSELSREVITYYRQRIDWALDQIESTEVTDSLILWKLYSSSVVIKTPGAIVGVDLCEGPNDDMYGRQQVPFCLTEAQRERLAALIGYSFHTHHHYDHLSHALVRDMAARGTPVFVTSQHRELWQDEPFAPLLHELEPEGEPVAVGPLQVRTFYGHQGSDACNAYLITTDSGVGVWVKGDVYDGDEHATFLQRLVSAGASVDLFVSSTWTKRGADIIEETRRLFDPVFVPTHGWEFTHRGQGESGPATQSYSHNGGVLAPNRGRAAILSWGEALHYSPLQP